MPAHLREPFAPSGRGVAGVSLVEILFALGLLAVILSIAGPPVGRMRAAAGVQNARHAAASSISVARTSAMRYGRPAVLRIDAVQDRLWAEIDTSISGGGEALTVAHFDFREQLGVDLESDRDALCFDGRGLSTARTQCPLLGARMVLAREGRVDTLVVSVSGRVMP